MNLEEAKNIKPGDILLNSWGYDMTINDYCKVIENTGKTLKCVMIKNEVSNDDGMGNGRSIPLPDQEFGKPFRIRISISKYDGNVWLVGSYPRDEEDGYKSRGCWFIWDGQPDYYNTWD